MYLLVDSGSTKADWVLFDQQSSEFFESGGINPSIQTEAYIEKQIEILANQFPKFSEKIFFYGAGTGSDQAKKKLIQLFEKKFPNSELSIHTDLLAAGRALCQGKESIICILGTGSHSALCDGHKIIHQLPSLGYILGDEGSGNHIGKEIIKAYFYQLMDTELKMAFEGKYPELASDFIYKIYQSHSPSSKLANIGQFVVENKNHPLCNQIIQNCFESFAISKLLVYKDKSHLPVHLCGSIAFYLKDEFELCLHKNGFILGDCIQKPIHKLLEYHRKTL